MRAVTDHAVPGNVPDDLRDAEDAAIVERACLDAAEFAPIYDRYYRPVFGYCLTRLHDADAAADATGQSFARALGGLHGFRGGSVRRWLFTIAGHVVIDSIRARRPHADLTAIPSLADPAPSPESRAIVSERERLLFAALAHLTDDQRHVVELRLAGLTAREIGDVLGTTTGAVKASQHRAFVRLRILLADNDLAGDLP